MSYGLLYPHDRILEGADRETVSAQQETAGHSSDRMKAMTKHDFKMSNLLSGKATRASSLLSFLAGDHAPALATLWPAPHEGFYALPTARRHAAAMLVSSPGERHALSRDGILRLIERQKDRVIADLLAGPAHSAGLMKALGKLGEVLWTEAEYACFLSLYSDENAGLYLRHLQEIRPHMLDIIDVLPAKLRQSRLLSFVRHKAAARDVRTAYDLIARFSDADHQKRAAERWCRAARRDRLFEMIREDLTAERPVRRSPPPLLPSPFRRIETVRQLKATALDFSNCLADYSDCFVAGRMAIYVWEGSPAAAVALNWNIDGWRLAEAEAAGNTELDEAPLRDIAEALEAKGVRIGSSIHNLRYRLSTYAHENESEIDARRSVAFSFRDQCDLGDLWN